jgi:WD40 repeat protein
LQLWDITSGRIKRTYGGQLGHHLDIYSLDCSSDGRFIASGSGDKTVKLWEKETGKVRQIRVVYVFTLANFVA